MNMKKNKGFSTLEIIASIFVIVVIFFVCIRPMQMYQRKKDAATILKKTYSELFQTLQMAVGENGDVSRWGFTGRFEDRKIIQTKIAPHLNLGENCLEKTGKCVPLENYKTLGNKYTSLNLSMLPAFTLANGASVMFDFMRSCNAQGSVCALIYIDVNGSAKPNMLGRDLFIFELKNSNSMLEPYNKKNKELISDAKEGCSKKSLAAKNCAALIYNNNWKIGDDYDW